MSAASAKSRAVEAQRIYCTEMVLSPGGFTPIWCAKTAIHDPDEDGNPTKCGTHSEKAKARRYAKKRARWDARDKAAAEKRRTEPMRNLLRRIEDGKVRVTPPAEVAEWLRAELEAEEVT